MFATKAALVRSIAVRVIAGEFDGSSSLASRDPECMALGVSHQSIDYHIGLINPDGGLARAADRARVETEVASAAVALHEVQYVFVERKGAAPAAAAVSRIMDKLESQLGAQVGNVAKMARRDASASSQVEIETAATEIEALVDELRQMKKRAADAAADAKQQIVALEAKLASSAGETKAAEAKTAVAVAKIAAMTEAKGEASQRTKMVAQNLARAQKRFADLDAKAGSRSCSSSGGEVTWDEEEVIELEGHIGELTVEVRELRREVGKSKGEYKRNRAAVANFIGKYRELEELKVCVKAERAKIELLTAEVEELRASPLPGRTVPLFDIRRDTTKRGGPYDPYFEDLIAPAMLNTGATPKQINEIIRKSTSFFYLPRSSS